MTDISNIVKYYQDLLIIQYNSKLKARATIAAMVNIILQNGILLDVLDGFNPETAVGKQLDILGKWIGVDRYYLGDGITQVLDDEQYKMVLQMKIINNSTDMSPSSIDNLLFDFFGTTIICSTENNLRIFYLVTDSAFNMASILLQKKVLPKPLGVRIGGIIKNEKWFGLSTYETFSYPIPDNVAGLANYENFLTKEGQILTYSDIYNP